MKIVINLEDVDPGNDWNDSVAEIIRDEIHAAIRSAVKSGMKEERARIQAAAKKAAAKAARDIEGESLKNFTAKVLERLQ